MLLTWGHVCFFSPYSPWKLNLCLSPAIQTSCLSLEVNSTSRRIFRVKSIYFSLCPLLLSWCYTKCFLLYGRVSLKLKHLQEIERCRIIVGSKLNSKQIGAGQVEVHLRQTFTPRSTTVWVHSISFMCWKFRLQVWMPFGSTSSGDRQNKKRKTYMSQLHLTKVLSAIP